MVHFLQVFGSDYVILLVCSKYSQTFYYVLLGNLSPVSRKLLYYVLSVTLLLRRKLFYLCALLVCRGFGQGLGHGFGQGFGVRIYLPFWYVGCRMRLEPVFLIFRKPRGIL